MTAEPASDVTFAVRPMRAEDEAFVYGSFLKEYRKSDHTAGIPNGTFFQIMKHQWSLVLQHFTVLVAHPEGSEDEVAGFIVFHVSSDPRPVRTVAWVTVKHHPWGRLGVAKLLAEKAGLKKTETTWVLYASSRLMARARAKGWRVELVPAMQANRLLLGVA